MTYTALTGWGPLYPAYPNSTVVAPQIANTANLTIDAAGEIVAGVGRCYINGRATSKTISSSGGKIHFLPAATITWATGGTAVNVAIQDVDATNGPPYRPDGTDDVLGTLVQGTDTLVASTWKTVTMSSGTKTISHGDMIAVVLTMTTRNGADAVRMAAVTHGASNAVGAFPGSAAFQSAAWTAASVGYLPIALIEFDDGTLGVLDMTLPIQAYTSETWTDATNPDERGLLFQHKGGNIKIDGIWFSLNPSANTGDCTLTVYSDPLGTPGTLYTANILAEQLSSTTIASPYFHTIAAGSEVALTADTDYAILIKATGAGNISMQYLNFNNAAYRFPLSNGTQLRKGTRNAGAGVITDASSTLVPIMGYRVSHTLDAAGATPYVIGG